MSVLRKVSHERYSRSCGMTSANRKRCSMMSHCPRMLPGWCIRTAKCSLPHRDPILTLAGGHAHPHPSSNRRGSNRNLSYSYVNESWGQVSRNRPDPILPTASKVLAGCIPHSRPCERAQERGTHRKGSLCSFKGWANPPEARVGPHAILGVVGITHDPISICAQSQAFISNRTLFDSAVPLYRSRNSAEESANWPYVK